MELTILYDLSIRLSTSASSDIAFFPDNDSGLACGLTPCSRIGKSPVSMDQIEWVLVVREMNIHCIYELAKCQHISLIGRLHSIRGDPCLALPCLGTVRGRTD